MQLFHGRILSRVRCWNPAQCYTCYQWLPPLLKPLHKRFPRVDVEIVPDVTRRALEALHERKIDLALVYSTRRDPRLRIVPLFEDEMVVIVARDHRLAFTKKGLVRKWGAATLKTSAAQPPIETLIELLTGVTP